jgi:hypothetical protein
MKIRYYGFMGSGSSVTIDDIRDAIELSLDIFVAGRPARKQERTSAYCPHRGGKLEYWYSISSYELWRPG